MKYVVEAQLIYWISIELLRINLEELSSGFLRR